MTEEGGTGGIKGVAVDETTETSLNVLKHDQSQCILAAASRKPMSAEELAEACEASLPTIYRRVNELTDAEFLETQLQLREDGNHYRVFETNIERIRLVVENGTFYADVKHRTDIVDRFGNLWQDLELDLTA